jgi:hypothetical protein
MRIHDTTMALNAVELGAREPLPKSSAKAV